MEKEYFNALRDFKELSPDKLVIEGDCIKVRTVLDFKGIKELFSFCVTAEKVGYTVYFEKEGITMSADNNDELQNIKVVMMFYEKLVKGAHEPI